MPLMPGASGRASHDNYRHGTTTLEVIRRGSFTGMPDLKKILKHIDSHDEAPCPFHWTATADRIFEKNE